MNPTSPWKVAAALTFSLAMFAANAPAATIVLRNTLDDGTGAHGIANSAFTPFDNTDADATNNGGGQIGRMTISDAAILAFWNVGNIAAIQAAFQPFAAPFTLESTGLAGAFLDTRSADTRASLNDFGGSAIYFWAFKGVTLGVASEHLIARLATSFPTDPESGPALSGTAHLRVGEVANLIVGGVGNFALDYGGGSGPLPGFNTVAPVPEPGVGSLLLVGTLFVIRRRRG
jgi:hypothetical protein